MRHIVREFLHLHSSGYFSVLSLVGRVAYCTAMSGPPANNFLASSSKTGGLFRSVLFFIRPRLCRCAVTLCNHLHYYCTCSRAPGWCVINSICNRVWACGVNISRAIPCFDHHPDDRGVHNISCYRRPHDMISYHQQYPTYQYPIPGDQVRYHSYKYCADDVHRRSS